MPQQTTDTIWVSKLGKGKLSLVRTNRTRYKLWLRSTQKAFFPSHHAAPGDGGRLPIQRWPTRPFGKLNKMIILCAAKDKQTSVFGDSGRSVASWSLYALAEWCGGRVREGGSHPMALSNGGSTTYDRSTGPLSKIYLGLMGCWR